MTGLRPETLLAQAAGADDPTTGGVVPPLQPSTTFLRDPDNAYRRGFDYARDNAVGVNFMVSPNFVLKAEMHEAQGYNYDNFVNPFTSDALKSRYGIVSAAVSF